MNLPQVTLIVATLFPLSEGLSETLPCVNARSAWTRLIGPRPTTYDITVDPAGNVLVAGYFDWINDFDTSDGVDEHVSNGGHDGFLTKLNGDGSYAWTYTVGGGGSTRSWASP